MTSSNPIPPAPPRSDLPIKIVILFLLAIISGLVIALMVKHGYPLAYLFMILFAASTIGLVSGFGARIILKERKIGWQLLASPAAVTSGLFVLGMATNWKYGLDPLSFKAGRFDLSGFIQVLTGFLVAGMSLFAWRKPKPVHAPAQSLQPARINLNQNLPADPTSSQVQVKTIPTRKNLVPKPSVTSTANSTTSRTRNRKPVKTDPKKPPATRTKRRSPKADVQFSTTEKFRCPYCLEPVLPDDPRGIVECKICHTPHHADCWAITGLCQVPHQNT